ncbi:hypothetical protein HYW21_04645 [Candidatus Woesearchaeota archaeon]|nr:hypothetical protein [Candidatus Woesearchaeota archaeon]
MEIRLTQDTLVIVFAGLEKVAALKGTLTIPRNCILLADASIPWKHWTWFRVGTYIPFFLKAGTFWTDKGKEFWYVKHGMYGLTVELQNAPYKRIVLGLSAKESMQWAKQINKGIFKRRSS